MTRTRTALVRFRSFTPIQRFWHCSVKTFKKIAPNFCGLLRNEKTCTLYTYTKCLFWQFLARKVKFKKGPANLKQGDQKTYLQLNEYETNKPKLDIRLFFDLAEFLCFYAVLAWPDHKIVLLWYAEQFYDQAMQELRKNREIQLNQQTIQCQVLT